MVGEVEEVTMGDRIKRLREEKDMSQEELGKLAGVQRAAVQKWENGQTKNLKSNVIKSQVLCPVLKAFLGQFC